MKVSCIFQDNAAFFVPEAGPAAGNDALRLPVWS